MTKREEQRKQADRDFEEVRKAVAAQSTEWLCNALREIPHRKWIEIEKDVHVAIGILSHRAAECIAEYRTEINLMHDDARRYEKALEIADRQFGYPARGDAVDDSCMCDYCQYARVRGGL